jgi:hypothetical protein
MHDRADGHGDVEVLPVAAGFERAFALAAALGGKFSGVAEVNEGVAMGIGDEIDGTARGAIAAVRAAARDELLAAKAERPCAAVSSGDVNFGLVYERRRRTSVGRFGDWMDADEPPARAVIFELHPAGNLREERVVLAQSDIEAGLKLAAALPDENRTAGDEVAVVALDAETLRIAVPTVARTSLALLGCHDNYPCLYT